MRFERPSSRRGQRSGSARRKRRAIRLRTSSRMKERNSAAAASNSPGEPLYRSQFSTRWAAKMLPPETEVMWVIRGRMPASRRNRTRPR